MFGLDEKVYPFLADKDLLAKLESLSDSFADPLQCFKADENVEKAVYYTIAGPSYPISEVKQVFELYDMSKETRIAELADDSKKRLHSAAFS